MSAYRTVFIDYDARHEPKTNRFCVKCQRDIKPDSPARVVHLVDGGTNALHPQDEEKYRREGNQAGDQGAWLLGPDCAKVVGLEWSVPE